MRVADIRADEVDDGVEWSATVAFAGREHVVRFGGPAALVDRADASMFLAATFLPAMRWQHDLHIEGTVSPLLLARTERLGRLYRTMDPTLRIPTVTATATAVPPAGGTGTACFFSRGIDSTYSAAVPRTEPGPLEALVYCRTLEPNHDAVTSGLELDLATKVAGRIGLPLHPIWTDLRSFTDPMIGWSDMHGSGLGAMALLVGQAFGALVVPTAFDLATLVPVGSHPAIDGLFGSEAVQVCHDHLDRGRQAKIDWLAAERPDLLALLKTCYSEDRVDNCGRCHKCLLTMAGLRAAGALDGASQFPAELDLDLLAAQRVAGIGLRHLWLGIAQKLHDTGDDPELLAAVSALLRQSAVPPLGELLGERWPLLRRLARRPAPAKPFDPERATTFEQFDRVHTTTTLSLVRHGEVHGPDGGPTPGRLRASTVAGSVAASWAHRRDRRRPPA